MEIWRDIKGYEGLYQVSNEGRVKSVERKVNGRWGEKTVREKILSQGKQTNGYMIVFPKKNGIGQTLLVHRLVANAFLPNSNNLPQVNHKDENKENNFVFINDDGSVDLEKSNLEWCTPKYNSNYGNRNKMVQENQTNRSDCSKKVYQYTLDGELVRVWESTCECGRNGFNQGHVAECCRGIKNKHKGYRWLYNPL